MFSDLSDDLLEPIVKKSKKVDLQRGDILFQEGDEPKELYIVTVGRIAIGNKSFDGRESLFALMEPGDLFGEMPLFRSDGRSAEASALTNFFVDRRFRPTWNVFLTVYDRE